MPTVSSREFHSCQLPAGTVARRSRSTCILLRTLIVHHRVGEGARDDGTGSAVGWGFMAGLPVRLVSPIEACSESTT
jgi:hypothetical protein